MGLTFRTLIIVIAWFVIACLVIGLTLWFTIFDQGVSGTRSQDIASEVFRADSFGALRLDLYPKPNSWQFLPTDEDQPYDVNTGACAKISRSETL